MQEISWLSCFLWPGPVLHFHSIEISPVLRTNHLLRNGMVGARRGAWKKVAVNPEKKEIYGRLENYFDV